MQLNVYRSSQASRLQGSFWAPAGPGSDSEDEEPTTEEESESEESTSSSDSDEGAKKGASKYELSRNANNSSELYPPMCSAVSLELTRYARQDQLA